MPRPLQAPLNMHRQPQRQIIQKSRRGEILLWPFKSGTAARQQNSRNVVQWSREPGTGRKRYPVRQPSRKLVPKISIFLT